MQRDAIRDLARDWKSRSSGLIVIVECGYRYRLLESDARVAHATLGIGVWNVSHHVSCRRTADSHQHKGSANASFPLHRLPFHLLRLVEAGFVCAVVGQATPTSLSGSSLTARREGVRRYALTTDRC